MQRAVIRELLRDMSLSELAQVMAEEAVGTFGRNMAGLLFEEMLRLASAAINRIQNGG